MKKSNYTLPVVLVALTIINIFSDFLVEFIANVFGDDVKNNVSKETLLIIFAVFILFTLALIIFQYFHEKKSAEPTSNNPTDSIEPDIKLLFNSLTERYKKRYESKLDGRFEITLEVNKEPFSVNYQTNKNIDEAFKAINESFNQKGRLLIVGSPGSGKTVLLLKLAIELLGEDCKPDQKLPVIFNLASWSEDYKTFDDWLIDVLNSGNGLSKDFARTLLEQNRIIFLLDGLDELARNEASETAIEKRAKCLDSLNDYLREGRKVVICCRREEFAAMQTATNQAAPVSAKVEVLDLSKDDIELALLFAKENTISNASATNLLKIIETNDIFLDVLATPFYFTTALEVFDSEILKEKDFPIDEAGIKQYLLDKFIDSKLKHASRLNQFEKDKTKILKWLSWLAKLMDRKQLITFELINLQPLDTRLNWFYGIINGLIVGYVTLLLFGEVTAIILALIYDLSVYKGRIKSDDIVKWSFKELFSIKNWSAVILFGGLSGLFMGSIAGLFFDFIFCITFGSLSCIAILLCVFIFGGVRRVYLFTQINSSYQRLTNGNVFSVFSILALVINIYLIWYSLNLILYPELPTKFNLWRFAVLGTTFGILAITIIKHSIIRICLYLEGSTPLKYATFLDLAAEARILEKDGGHWRFRHQTLQVHFAESGNDLSA